MHAPTYARLKRFTRHGSVCITDREPEAEIHRLSREERLYKKHTKSDDNMTPRLGNNGLFM